MPDVAEIAGRLSEAQRLAVRWFAASNKIDVDLIRGTGRSSEWPTIATIKSLAAKNILLIEYRMGGWSADITPLGLAVRAYLENSRD